MKLSRNLLFKLLPSLIGISVAIAQDRPNVLFIAVDDLRPELGCYGKHQVLSPNIDRIANAGITFDRAYCQQAVCAPSRTSVMTGARPDTTQVWDLQTHFRNAMPDVVTLGQHFKANGYFVQGIGKIYHGKLNDEPTWSVPWQVPKSVPYALPENIALSERRTSVAPGDSPAEKADNSPSGKLLEGLNSRGPAFEGADVPDESFTDGKVAALAVSTLKELATKKEPFFLAVGFVKPHLPFVSPKKYWDLYKPADIKLAPNPFPQKDVPDYSILPGSELRLYHGVPEGPIPPDVARQLIHGYYAAISYTDAQIGKVLDEIERLGLAKNTIIVLWGDHGWKLGEHEAWCKHSNSENDTNAPLLISAPGMKNRGSHTKALVEFVDIYPTLSDLAGLPLPAHLEGISLKPLLEDPARPWKTAAFSQYPRSASRTGEGDLMGYSMRTDRYRFTVWVDRTDHSKIAALELYDHETDPQENTNIAADPKNKALVEDLMNQWRGGWRGARPVSKS